MFRQQLLLLLFFLIIIIPTENKYENRHSMTKLSYSWQIQILKYTFIKLSQLQKLKVIIFLC